MNSKPPHKKSRTTPTPAHSESPNHTTDAELTDTRVEQLSGDPNFMTSLARGLMVIRAFSEQRRTMSIAQISQKTGISRAAVRRCLYTLERLGYVAAQDNAYALRPQILSLGHTYLAATPLATLAQSYLDRVSDQVRESCSAAILDADEVVYIARSAVTHIMSLHLLVGTRLPAYCTSMGRVLLANLPEADLETYLKRIKLRPHTVKSITSMTKLRELLKKIRRDDFTIVDQELELGLRSIAVPIRDRTGRVVAAMNVGAQAARISVRDLESQVLPHLQSAARDLGASLVGN